MKLTSSLFTSSLFHLFAAARLSLPFSTPSLQEKMSPEAYTLACILPFPPYQRKGYGNPSYTTPFIHPLYTYITIFTPMYTRYTCIYVIYTPYIHLTHL